MNALERNTMAPLAVEPKTGGQTPEFELDSNKIGALPIINHFLCRLNVAELFDKYVPSKKLQVISHSDALLILIRSILINRHPLYGIGEWAAEYDAMALGLNGTDP